MTRSNVKVAPINALVLVMDRTKGVIPDSMSQRLVAATSSCIAVGTLSEHDGETTMLRPQQNPDSNASKL